MSQVVGSGKGPDSLRHHSRITGVVWKWIVASWPWRRDIKVGKPGQCCSALIGEVCGHEIRLGVTGWTHAENDTGVGYTVEIEMGDNTIAYDEEHFPTRQEAQGRAEDLLGELISAFGRLPMT